jgi:outer membrane protein OmpA-like peptidoglycan-associated protein
VTPIKLQVSQADFQVENLAIREDGTLDPVITIPLLNVKGVDVDLATQDVTVGSVAVERASFTAWLNPDGTVNYQQLFVPIDSVNPSPVAGSSPPKPKDENPWAVLIKEITLKDHSIDFEDRSLQTLAHIEVRALTFKTHDVRIPIKQALPIEVTMQLNDTGTIRVNGSVLPSPLQADAALTLKDIAIRPFQPYLEKFARIDVQSGTVNLDGTVHLAAEHPNGPLMSYEGNVSVEALSIADRDQGDEVASLQALSLNKVRLTIDPTTASIQEVGLQQPTVHLVVQPDGGLNLAKLVAVSPSPTSGGEQTPEAQRAKSPPVPVTVGVVKLAKAAATFEDYSVKPSVHTALSDLSGTIKGLSSKELARADVQLTGRVGKVAQLKVAGVINPLTEDAFTDLTITLGGMDLTAQGPYSGKYVGYGLAKGKLSIDLKYKVSKKQLEAENKIAVDQLTFGDKVDSPDALSLPVKLAVALLTDRNGRIDIDLPIRGDLKDPDFKYGRVVISALLNLLTKIVASPFTLMGKLIPGGGDGEDLQFIEFAPGSATVSDGELKKLEVLAKGLEERPGLRLDITGTSDPTSDRAAIGLRKLKVLLVAIRQRERRQGSSKSEELSSEDETRLVTELYEKQRAQIEKSAPSKLTEAAPTPPTVMEMKQRLAAEIPVDEPELRALARERAEQVRDQLIGGGRLAEERVFLQETDQTVSGNDQVRSRLTITAGS